MEQGGTYETTWNFKGVSKWFQIVSYLNRSDIKQHETTWNKMELLKQYNAVSEYNLPLSSFGISAKLYVIDQTTIPVANLKAL